MTYIIIILITTLVSYSAFNKPELMYKFQFNPYQVYHSKQYYRIFSHALIHGDWNHLIFNMLTLYFFGSSVEQGFDAIFGAMGVIYFVFMYISAIVASSLYTLNKHKNNSWYNAVGASGAVSAILYSSILLYPMNKIYIFFIPIGIPAIIFGVVYLFYSAYMSKRGGDNIGHDAHFWGAIYGFIFPLVLEPKLIFYFLDRLSNF